MTIYGRGGVDVREPRRLHPGVLALVVVAGFIVVTAIGYFVFRDPEEPTPQAATAPSAAPPAAVSPAAAESPSPSAAPDGLRTGSWLVTPAGDDDDTYLVADGEFAAMSDEPETLTVVAGLADDSCFTFRDGNGDYLRHFDYRLRFDPLDDSELFRKDATFCAEDDQPAGSFRLRSTNYPEYFLHRRDDELYIDRPDDDDRDEFVEESTFSLRLPPS